MKVSLIITTYNWESALRLSLKSVLKQTQLPLDVVVADDGSRPSTQALIDEMREQFPCKLKHVWQEDKGFRAGKIRNRAFAVCEGEYIIQIDGDIIMHPRFIEDHMKEARKGYFLSGGRVKLKEGVSADFEKAGEYKLSFFSKGIRRRINGLRCPLLTPFFHNYKKGRMYGRGCNMSFWKEDLWAVNGYDEAFVGYGFEDFDLPARLNRYGIQRRFIKFKAIEYHIYHNEHSTKHDMSVNESIYNRNNENKLIRCQYGIDQYLEQGNNSCKEEKGFK